MWKLFHLLLGKEVFVLEIIELFLSRFFILRSSPTDHRSCLVLAFLFPATYDGYGVRSGLGDRLLIDSKRKVRTPAGRVLGNAQAEKSDTGATENKPPMNGVFL